MRIKERKMETTIMGYMGFRVQGLWRRLQGLVFITYGS